jgi:plastocyanin
MILLSRLTACALACTAVAAVSRASTIVVTQSGFGFVPANITINVGDTVQWNHQQFDHTITEGTDGIVNGNEAFHMLLDSNNPVVTLTFTQAFVDAHPMPGGVFNYVCITHFPVMTGSITVNPAPSTGTPYCFGDGSGTPCPCGNSSAVGSSLGCLHSLGTGGGLTATGSPSVTGDTVVLAGAGMPNSSALYFQGTTQPGAGLGAVFGDGLRCTAGTVTRLGTKTNAGGGSTWPSGADPAVSVKGNVPAGATRNYQVWYRNAASFCTVSTFNLTNGYSIAWTP